MQKIIQVRNVRGLHGRVATRLKEIADAFAGEIVLLAGEQEAGCDSVLAILGMGLAHGAEVTVRVVGDGASGALDAIEAILTMETDP